MQIKAFDLIWKRTIGATSAAKLERTAVDYEQRWSGRPARGWSGRSFDGFLKVYEGRDDTSNDGEAALPQLMQGKC